jgi:hypothetical protein
MGAKGANHIAMLWRGIVKVVVEFVRTAASEIAKAAAPAAAQPNTVG